MKRGYITKVVKRNDEGFGTSFEVCVDETKNTHTVLRKNIKGNHWCIGWHGYVNTTNLKQVEFYPDR